MLKSLSALACGTAVAVALVSLAPAEPPPAPHVSWVPAHPIQGSIVQIVVRRDTADDGSDPILELGAVLAGEALHFEPDGTGAFRALAGIPVDAAGELDLSVLVRRDSGARDTVTATLPVAPGDYEMERLRVAPEFGREPDAEIAARLASERARARAVSRNSHDTPRLWEGEFIRPREDRITSGYGHGREYNGTVQSRHMGLDLDGAPGAPVRATNRAVVALVADFYLAGNAIYLDHGAGLVTAYFHLSETEVAEGDTVSAGQVIGRVGATGRVTGPHLHWTVRYGGITVNPLTLLEVQPFPTPSQP